MIGTILTAAPVHKAPAPVHQASSAGAGIGLTLSLALVLGVVAVAMKFRGSVTWPAAALWFTFGAAMAGGTVAGIMLSLSSTGLGAVQNVISGAGR